MHYSVKARLIPDTAADFLTKLTDGTIEGQRPDGREIVASMKRAKLDEDGVVFWSEVCYCPTPLEHERETVYDRHFVDLTTKEMDGHAEFEGDPFMEYLARHAERS